MVPVELDTTDLMEANTNNKIWFLALSSFDS